jgi:agmatinase
MRDQGMRWHLMGEMLDRGVETVIDRAIDEALDGPEFIYLSVDIDVLDPGFAPGTGTPEPGGMQPADLLRAVRKKVQSWRADGPRGPGELDPIGAALGGRRPALRQ